MPAGTVIPTLHEHGKVKDDLDDAYVEAVAMATMVRGFLLTGRGNLHEEFFQFYYPFTALFFHTRHLREMKNVEANLITDISNWIDDERAPDRQRMRKGLELFSKYQKAIIDNGVIVLQK